MAETKKIVRILYTDVNGSLGTERALRKIKGISFMFSRNLCVSLGMDSRKKVGDLSDDEIKRIESFIKEPAFPGWMMNRRKDYETGKDLHAVMSDLDLRKKEIRRAESMLRQFRRRARELQARRNEKEEAVLLATVNNIGIKCQNLENVLEVSLDDML